ncbi:MAG: PKD domain-containing protein [Thermoplasmatales archaeon]|nr:MAG: PKD domain-containing protein [Thermoplasmatales archaeon]
MIKKLFKLFVVGIVLSMLGNITFAVAYSNEMLSVSEEHIIKNNDVEPLMAPDWYSKPASYEELVGWYLALEADYPDYLEVFKANELYDTGIATGGYDMYYVRITNEALGLHKPEVLFLGNPHGDEVVGCVGLYWFTDWLMRMAFTDEKNDEFSKEYLQWIIDNREIYIEVLHNPYGYDHGPQRYDGNGWDLNREADMDGPGSPTGGIWASVPGKTLVEFINNHLCRVGADFHAGVRMILYPWGSHHSNVIGQSPISGYSYTYAPPDFYYFDTSSLRVGSFMGNYGGELDENNIGTIPGTVGYPVQGGICPWGYGADIDKNPVEDPYVQNDHYPGAGLLWLSPEMSQIKNVPESDFGNDTIDRYGAEVRWFVLHHTDLAQPYVSWHPSSIENNGEIPPGTIPLKWQVNGSMVVDHTYIQWGTDPDPINNYEHTTPDNDEYAGKYIGGTGWDGAETGSTNGVIYDGNLYISTPGDYYFVAKAQVDQVYADVLRPDIYGDDPYLRLIKERTNDSYYEVLEGTDGTEEIFGQTWWYSDIIHVSVVNDAPNIPTKPDGPKNGKVGIEYTYSTKTFDDDGDKVYYQWDWDDGTTSDWEGPYFSGETVEATHTWTSAGNYQVKVKSKDVFEYESEWSDSLGVSIPRARVSMISLLTRIIEQIKIRFPIFNFLLES